MATNPMQRKARNSFLLGMLVMLLISGVIIALLFMQLSNKIKKEQEELKASVGVVVLKQDVKSGQVITSDMLEEKIVNKNLVPSNATSDFSVFQNAYLNDKEGNSILTLYDKNGNAFLYTIKRLYSSNNGDVFINCLIEKEKETGNYYMQKYYDEYIYIEKDKEENVKLYIGESETKKEIKKNDEKNEYYVKVNNTEKTINIDKEYIELNKTPLIAKVSMKKNTVITTELLSKSDNVVKDDVRKQEYNMIVLPMDLATGDYIDIRVMFPNGQDFIVVSKKEVEIPIIGDIDSEDTIWINLSEDEILHMSCAIVDSAQVNGAKIYATKYTEAGMQNAAIPTYPINESTSKLLQSNPNIVQKAMDEILTRYNNGNSAELRNNYINSAINSQGTQAQSNLETNMEESITNSKNSRKEYLDSLMGTTAE